MIKQLDLQDSPILLMVSLVFSTVVVKNVIGSASAKWTLLAPIFGADVYAAALLVEVGARCVSGGRQFHQDNYAADTNVSRYLDDSRNTTRSRSQILEVKNPNEVGMNRYFPLILGFAVRHVPKTGIGTMIAIMLPYSVALLLAWALMLMSWIALGLPVGLGAGLLLAKGKDRLVSPAKRLPVTTRRALCMTLTTQLRNRG